MAEMEKGYDFYSRIRDHTRPITREHHELNTNTRTDITTCMALSWMLTAALEGDNKRKAIIKLKKFPIGWPEPQP